jgi:cellulose biosynthesis protein BcsQ
MVSLLDTPQLFKKCFHRIIVFMPSHSRGSLKNNIFEQLPEEQLYDRLDAEAINNVFDQIESNADDGMFTLIILDDVQQNLKDKYVAKKLLEIVANRRHLKTSVWLLAQTYKSVPRQIRQVITNLFVFKINKTEMENIFTEQVELFKEHFQRILKKSYMEPHDYLFIDTGTQRLFRGFDEILLEDESSDDEDV